MASTSEIVELLFKAEYRGKADVARLKRDMNDLSHNFGDAVSTLSGLTTALLAVEAAALATGVALTKAGVEAASKFQSQFAEITTLIDGTTEDFKGLEQQIKDYAANSVYSFEQLNGAIYNAISAGVDYKDSVKFVSEAERLSVAGKADLNETIKVLTGTLNAYGESTDQAGKYADMMFNIVKNGVTTLPELAKSLGEITGTSASLGVGFNEIAASLEVLTKAGLDSSKATTGLKAVLSNLLKPTQAANEVAKQYGLTLGTAGIQANGFAGTLKQIVEKTHGNKEAINQLFGSTEALNVMFTLTSKQGFKQFSQALNDVKNSTGEVEQAYQKMSATLENQQKKLSNNVNLALQAIGSPLLDEVGKTTGRIADIFATLTDELQDGALKPLVGKIEELAGVIYDKFNDLANNLSDGLGQADLSGFTDAIDSIIEVIDGFDMSAEGVASGAEAIADAFNSLTEFSMGVVDVLGDAIATFKELASYLPEIDGDTVAYAGTLGAFAVTVSTVTTALTPFIAVLKVLKGMGGVAGSFGKVEGLGSKLSGVAKAAGVLSAGFAGFEVGGMIVEKLDEKTGFLTGSLKESSVAGEALTQSLEKFRKETGNANATLSDYAKYVQEKVKREKESKQAVDELSKAQKGAFTLDLSSQKDEVSQFKKTVEATNETLKKSKDAAKVAGSAVKDFGEQNAKAKEKVDALKLKAIESREQLARMKNIGLEIKFKTAAVKAQAAEIKAIMGSLGKTGAETGKALSSAFSFLGSGEFSKIGKGSLFGDQMRQSLISSIKDMSVAQKEVAEAQAKIADEKAELLKSQRQKLDSGEPIISIDGAGLEPEIEAFMFKILRNIQVKMSESQSAYLLGIGQ